MSNVKKTLRQILGDRIISTRVGKSSTIFTVRCPSDGCSGTCVVEKIKNINRTCRECQFKTMRKLPHITNYNKIVKRSKECTGDRANFMSYEEFISFCESPDNHICSYCGVDTPRPPHALKGKPLLIDRKDSSKGYTIDNCVSCCWECNQMKSDWFTAEQFKLIRMIYDNKLLELKKELESINA